MIGYIGRISPRRQAHRRVGPAAEYAGSTTWARSASSCRTSASCTARPASRRSRSPPAAAPCARCRARRRCRQQPACCRSTSGCSSSSRSVRRSPRRAGRDRARTGDVLAFVSKPSFDPNLFVDGIDPRPGRRSTSRRQAAAEPAAARHLSARLDVQAVHGAGRAHHRRAHAATPRSATPATSSSGATGSATPSPAATARWTCTSRSWSRATPTTTARLRDGRRRHPRLHEALGFGQLTGIDLEDESTGMLPSRAWKLKRYRQAVPEEHQVVPRRHASPPASARATTRSRPPARARHRDAGQRRRGDAAAHRQASRPARRASAPAARDAEAPDRAEARAPRGDRTRWSTSTGSAPADAPSPAPSTSGGKTGTAQVISARARNTTRARSPSVRDHSLFMAFAPADKPTLALAVIVENGGFGAQAAAPIARKVFDYYLLGKRRRRRRRAWPAAPTQRRRERRWPSIARPRLGGRCTRRIDSFLFGARWRSSAVGPGHAVLGGARSPPASTATAQPRARVGR